MLGRTCAHGGLVGFWMLMLGPIAAAPGAVTVALDTSPDSPISGQWASGDTIEVIVTATTDGSSVQGFAFADFKSGQDFGILCDPAKVQISDLLAGGTSVQVDTETMAGAFDGMGSYVKAHDTWVYDNYADFTGSVDMAGGSFKAVCLENNEPTNHALGVGAPVNVLHLALKITGLAAGESTTVSFTGQVLAFNVGAGEVEAVFFGTPTGGDIGSGSFTLQNVPEPATCAILFIGMCYILKRRRRR